MELVPRPVSSLFVNSPHLQFRFEFCWLVLFILALFLVLIEYLAMPMAKPNPNIEPFRLFSCRKREAQDNLAELRSRGFEGYSKIVELLVERAEFIRQTALVK